MPSITRIALSGGPGGGKTSALPIIANHFKEFGYKVYTVPEIATLFHSNGIDLLQKVKTAVYELEHSVFRAQIGLEDSMMHLASTNDQDTLILCDRGLGDFRAYIAPELWIKLLQDYRMTQDELFSRYDGVIHLMTAAIGAEQFFTNENNPARNCTPELAKNLDLSTYLAWATHPKHVVIENDGIDFEQKVQTAIVEIESIIVEKK